MLKIATIIGARPQFIKAAVLSNTINTHYSKYISESLIHTGQHYDNNMSDVFFQELNIPSPAVILSSKSENAENLIAEMEVGISKALLSIQPDYAIVFGDTNSTLAGASAAKKCGIKLIHIESGLRSYNTSEPEEFNRRRTDELADILYCPCENAILNLQKEHIYTNNQNTQSVFNSGDIMLDLFLQSSKLNRVDGNFSIPENFILTTFHRAGNTKNTIKLNQLLESIIKLSEEGNNFVIPLHPGSRKAIEQTISASTKKLFFESNHINIIPPTSYLETITLINHSSMVITDSGGLQKEAYFGRKFCIVLRDETEWTELVESECSILAGADYTRIKEGIGLFKSRQFANSSNFYGNGNASRYICDSLLNLHNGA